MRKAYRLIDNCETYIFFSTDKTGKYLAESLKWIAGIAPTLAQTRGNATGTSGEFQSAARFHAVVGQAIRWLQANWGLSPEDVKAKYPTLVADGLAEAKRDSESGIDFQISWVYGQLNRELPNLLSRHMHRDRLGEVIDELLGLTGTADAAERTEREAGQAQEIKRYSPQS
jgi:hypothetical protein